MALGWKRSLSAFLVIGLVACQPGSTGGAEAVPGAENDEETSVFRPYRDSEVPRLKGLVEAEGFRSFVSRQPYILGASYDGTYLATIVCEKSAGMYRVEIHHTGTNRLEETLYVPASEALEKDAGEGGNGEAEERLKLSQETLDLGYRIKIPLRPREAAPGQQTVAMGREKLHLRLESRDRRLTLSAKKAGSDWTVWQAPLEAGERAGDRWLAVSPTGTGLKWTAVAWVVAKDGVVPLVRTVEPAILKSGWAETRIRERTQTLLGPDAAVVYRGELTAEGPDSLLAVRGEEQAARSRDGAVYRGTVRRFLLLDAGGKVRFRGNSAGLVRDEQVLVDPTLPRGTELRYRLLLSVQEGRDGQQARTLTVDQLDGSGRLLRTYELEWNPDSGRFRLTSEKREESIRWKPTST